MATMSAEEVSVIELLGQKYTMELILKIRDDPGCTKTSLANGGSDKTKMGRIKDLIDYGVVIADDDNRQFNSIQLSLTPKGQKIAKLLVDLDELGTLTRIKSDS